MMILPVYVEMGAVALGALSGALHGMRKGADAMGVLILSVVTAVGGGMLRDVLLSHGPPTALRVPRYLAAVAACAVLSMLFGPWFSRLNRVLDYVDAMLLGVWLVLGLEKALALQLSVPGSIFLGLLTAVGGGVLRDVLNGERPSLISPGELYATPALIAAFLYVALVLGLKMRPIVGEFAAVGVASFLRLLAMRHRWTLPGQVDLRLWWHRWRRPRG
ncbi:TRIC cation channel family protein [Myxococcaceae bacterium JPH2]|nr:TRIC cation channel family protein [Myxococcaceae bacterium JPH2]